MKLIDLFESENKYLYHVTFTKNVPKIKEQGLLQFQTSNWVKGDADGSRYNEEAGVFAFEHPEDAFRWAFKMDWDFADDDISIVRLNIGEDWGDDPAIDPISQAGAKGRWLRSGRNRKAEEIVDSISLKDFGGPIELGINQEEWIAGIVDKLRL